MIAIVCFFVGLFLLASGEEIGILTDAGYVSIICNVVSCGLMGYGAFDFLGKRNKEVIHTLCSGQEKCKDSVEKLYGELREFVEFFQNNVPSNEEIQSNAREIRVELQNVKKAIGESNDAVSQTIEKQVSELKSAMESQGRSEMESSDHLRCQIESSQKEIQNSLNEIRMELQSVEKSIEKSNDAVSQTMEKQVSELKSAMESQGRSEMEGRDHLRCQIESLQKEIHTDHMVCKETLDKFGSTIMQSGEEAGKKLENISEEIEEICRIPQEFSEQVESLVVIVNKYTADLTTKMEYLSEDLEEQDKNRMKDFHKMLEKLREDSSERNEEVAEKMEILSQQYLQFKQTVEVIVQKLTAMAESDIEVMKGFLNG